MDISTINSIDHLAESFPPSWRNDARVLILGSMPGVASLTAQQYYAHPRNAFWPIMAQLLGVDSTLDYEMRLAKLRDRGIALWDVIGRCQRSGSLDSAIEADSIEINPLVEWAVELDQLRLIICNGGTAYQQFRRHAEREILARRPDLTILRLPSTSPAYAAKRFEQKREEWAVLLDYL